MPVFCENCGHQNRNSAKFCQGCGGQIITTASDGTLTPGVVLDKRYEIECLIKSGGMGAVYKALDKRFKNKPCAVKEMLSSLSSAKEQDYYINRFEKEAEILHDLKHSNLPVVKDYFVEAGRYYLVMEYIEGKDLDTIMRGYGGAGVPPELVIEWSRQILDVLDYLHNQSPPVIYRDLKPANIMLRNSDGMVNLIDFGIARTVTPGNQSTMTGIGTPVYAPKELLMGKPETGSDIYSLGATMHFLLTLQQSALSFFPPVREIRPDVSLKTERIIAKVLSYNPAERFASAHQMADALTEMVETLIFRSEEKKEKKLFGGEKFIPLTGKDDFYEEEGFAEESEFPVISEHSDLDIPLDKDEISMLLGEVEKSPGRLKGNDAKNSSAVKKNLPEKSVKPQKKTEEKKQKKSFDMFRWFKK